MLWSVTACCLCTSEQWILLMCLWARHFIILASGNVVSLSGCWLEGLMVIGKFFSLYTDQKSHYLDVTKHTGLGFQQLVRSRFSNAMCPKNETSWRPEHPEWPVYSICGFLDVADIFSLITLILWKCGSGIWDITFTHGLTPLRTYGMTGDGFAQCSHSPIITRWWDDKNPM